MARARPRCEDWSPGRSRMPTICWPPHSRSRPTVTPSPRRPSSWSWRGPGPRPASWPPFTVDTANPGSTIHGRRRVPASGQGRPGPAGHPGHSGRAIPTGPSGIRTWGAVRRWESRRHTRRSRPSSLTRPAVSAALHSRMLQETLDSLSVEESKTAGTNSAQIIAELDGQAVELEAKAKELRNKIESLKTKTEQGSGVKESRPAVLDFQVS